MTRFTDGPNISLDEITKATAKFREESPRAVFPIAPKENRYWFLFERLQDNPENLLDPDPAANTAEKLIRLADAMVDPNPTQAAGDSRIPSAYTYLGQFIDHDITRQSIPGNPVPNATTLPLTLEEIKNTSNIRTIALDLDCVYGPAIEQGTSYQVPRNLENDEKLLIERTSTLPTTTELPREQTPPHFARIGDRRNDENLMVSQMHLAFLLAHNRLIDGGKSYESARQELRRHYQWMVVNDYLFRIADPDIVNSFLDGTLNPFDPPDDATFMPLEFSVGAFRFAHSMIRDSYNYNSIFEKAPLFNLLLPAFLQQYHHVPTDWTIDWRRFINGGRNVARLIDTNLARGLKPIDDGQGHVIPFGLAGVDLLRGFLLRLPTGQAVAASLEEAELPTARMLDVVGAAQAAVLVQTGFDRRTPLWFYILAEARASETGRLGRVGSKLVASVLIGLARKSRDSYFRVKDWAPTLGTGARFDLPDLFRLAGVLPNDN